MFTYELEGAISARKQMTVGKGSRADLLMSCLRTPLRTAGAFIRTGGDEDERSTKMHVHGTNARRKIK